MDRGVDLDWSRSPCRICKNGEIQSLVLSPLIGRILGEVSTGLVLESEMDELGSSNSHSSWGDSVCVVWFNMP